ncbi:MAG: DUF5130 family protein [Nocardioides sp.]|uniref:DUF5130 family protein n=1 Tax=Nocardioides sp. TaxID=35761 RepID=UPI003F066230
MASSDLLSAQERLVLDAAIRRAEQTSRFEFSVYLGPVEGTESRPFATQLHNRLVAPSRSVLIMVDPTARAIEVVTGGEVRRNISDAEVELAVRAMADDLSHGNYATGLVRGIDLLAEHARRS